MNIYTVSVVFEYTWTSLISLIIGIFLGVVLLSLFYVLAALKRIEKEDKIVTSKERQYEGKQVIIYIQEAKKEFLKQKKKDKGITWSNYQSTSVTLIQKVAQECFPQSDKPMAELSFKEMIAVDRYLMKKLEELIDKTGIKIFKKVRVSTIISLMNFKQGIENIKIVKFTKKIKLDKVFSYFIWIINFLSPATWFSRLIINPSLRLITKKICLVLISIVGQETYNVYSKQAIKEPDEVDIELYGEEILNRPTSEITTSELRKLGTEDYEINEIGKLLCQTDEVNRHRFLDKLKLKKKKK